MTPYFPISCRPKIVRTLRNTQYFDTSANVEFTLALRAFDTSRLLYVETIISSLLLFEVYSVFLTPNLLCVHYRFEDILKELPMSY